MKQKAKNILVFIVILIAIIVAVGSIYYRIGYPNQDFDEILFHLFNGAEHTSTNVVNHVIKSCFLPVILLTAILYIPAIRTDKNKILNVTTKQKEYNVQVFPIKFISNHRKIYLTIILIISLIIAITGFKIDKYIVYKIQQTKLFEEYYVNAKDVNITFPENKRNLIIIIAESMENSLMSRENGGDRNYSVIPELEVLAKENTNFSNTENLGGMQQVNGANFTAAGIISMHSGTPLLVGSFVENYNVYRGNGKYLGGAYALGDILKDEGYNLETMMGSYATFGGRYEYLTTHGQYKIFDYEYALNQNIMTEQEKRWWGFEDDRLFAWSKQEIIKLSKEDKPFNYIMLTADTHFPDGYLSRNAERKFDTKYENVYAYSSKMIYEFVRWIQEQPFYKNTTIVIIGDHLGMQENFYNTQEGYTRTVYNTIINSAIEETNSKNRVFTTMDMFPTILASIGVEIEGEKLGLGTNLYSGIPTLAETIGIQELDTELRKNSSFYNKKILGDDYYTIKVNERKGDSWFYE